MSMPLSQCEHCGQQYLNFGGLGHGCPKSHAAPRRSSRIRRTPEEAEAELLQKRMQEDAERERRREERRQIADQASSALLGQPPVETADRSSLDTMAHAIHHSYHWDGKGDQCVTAVVETKSNTYVVFPQRHMLCMDEYAKKHYSGHTLEIMAGGGSHLHAEMYAVLHFLRMGQAPGKMIEKLGVSKPICPDCKEVLDFLGIKYTLRWVTATPSDHWKDPWRELGLEPPERKKDRDRDEKGNGSGTG